MNIFKDRVHIQLKVVTEVTLGQTIKWKPVETRYARVTAVSARTKAEYQQLKTEVTHRVAFRDAVSLNIGLNRFIWKDRTLELVDPLHKEIDTQR